MTLGVFIGTIICAIVAVGAIVGCLVFLYKSGAPEMIFPQTAFKFEFVEIAMDGVVHYSPADIDKIVATFTMLD